MKSGATGLSLVVEVEASVVVVVSPDAVESGDGEDVVEGPAGVVVAVVDGVPAPGSPPPHAATSSATTGTSATNLLTGGQCMGGRPLVVIDAATGQSEVDAIRHEPIPFLQVPDQRREILQRHVLDPAAHLADQMLMARTAVQVVDPGPMAQMDVGDQARPGKGVEGAVDG